MQNSNVSRFWSTHWSCRLDVFLFSAFWSVSAPVASSAVTTALFRTSRRTSWLVWTNFMSSTLPFLPAPSVFFASIVLVVRQGMTMSTLSSSSSSQAARLLAVDCQLFWVYAEFSSSWRWVGLSFCEIISVVSLICKINLQSSCFSLQNFIIFIMSSSTEL